MVRGRSAIGVSFVDLAEFHLDSPGCYTMRRHPHGRALATLTADGAGWSLYIPGCPAEWRPTLDAAKARAREVIAEREARA